MSPKALSLTLIILLSFSQLTNIYSFFIKAEYMYMTETIFMYLAYLIFVYIDIVKKLNIKQYIKILITLTIILHSSLGHNLKLYIITNWFDDFLHFFGTFSFTLLIYFLIRTTISFYSNSRAFIFILVLSLGISIGAIFEIVEFSSDVIFNTNHQKGLTDTNLDLIFDVLGAIFASFFVILKENSM
jgi:uncharacterized membrane protein YjdF